VDDGAAGRADAARDPQAPAPRDVRRSRTLALQQARRRRALAFIAGGALLAGLLTSVLAGGDDDAAPDRKADAAKAPPQLPGGGTRLFPQRRIVAAYGSPRAPELGTLGVGSLTSAVTRLRRQARPYAKRTRPVLPALELIAVIATAAPGPGALHRDRLPAAQIDRHLRVARANKALLILDVQPGRSDFMTEVRPLLRWLREPDVSLALDPEWRVGPGELPGRVIGSTDAREINAVSAWLARLVRVRKLPEKLLLVHQFTDSMIRDKAAVLRRPGLAITYNVDGFGGQAIKRAKYHDFAGTNRTGFHDGFKLFYEEDTDLMSPRQVLAMRPPPDVIVYE
jgi:hypothetical protein